MVEVYFIEGRQNSGKSTLVRCLSGAGISRNGHADCKNVFELDWRVNGVIQKIKTLVLASSVNEGAPINQILPRNLSFILKQYENNCGAKRAILTVNSSIRNSAINVQTYANLIPNQLAPHSISGIATLDQGQSLIAAHVAGLAIPNILIIGPGPNLVAPTARNTVAASVRGAWNLV
jgi:energy-coupling factor transporter ATP-binding protein EcfA2